MSGFNFLNDIASTYPMKIGYYSKGKNEKDLYNCYKIPFAGFGYDHTINLYNIFNNQIYFISIYKNNILRC